MSWLSVVQKRGDLLIISDGRVSEPFLDIDTLTVVMPAERLFGIFEIECLEGFIVVTALEAGRHDADAIRGLFCPFPDEGISVARSGLGNKINVKENSLLKCAASWSAIS